MKNLRNIRVLLCILFFATAAGYAFFPTPVHPVSRLIPRTQIAPSLIAVSFGAILFWLVVTLLLGRVYCASFCPVGAVQDGVSFLRRRLGKRPRRSGFRPAGKLRYKILIGYAVCLIVGITAVPYIMEPWNMFCNLAAVTNPTVVEATWMRLGTGALTGIVAGAVSLLLISLWAWRADREFCNVVCPVGTLLSLTEPRNLMHIEINPDKCINCMRCEEVCPAGCVKVVSRYVDNTRCVRCFDCLAVCPNDAIRYQVNRNRPATPLSKRVGAGG